MLKIGEGIESWEGNHIPKRRGRVSPPVLSQVPIKSEIKILCPSPDTPAPPARAKNNLPQRRVLLWSDRATAESVIEETILTRNRRVIRGMDTGTNSETER